MVKFRVEVKLMGASFFLVLQSTPVFTFANQAGLDMLETTLLALQDITLDKIFDESGRRELHADFAKLIEQVVFPPYIQINYKFTYILY